MDKALPALCPRWGKEVTGVVDGRRRAPRGNSIPRRHRARRQAGRPSFQSIELCARRSISFHPAPPANRRELGPSRPLFELRRRIISRRMRWTMADEASAKAAVPRSPGCSSFAISGFLCAQQRFFAQRSISSQKKSIYLLRVLFGGTPCWPFHAGVGPLVKDASMLQSTLHLNFFFPINVTLGHLG